MKRLFSIGLMLVSAFALTNCAEEIAAPVQDDIIVDGNIENITPPEEEVNIPFEVFATVGGEAETKTQNVGNGTYWVANDGISVFHKTGNKITHNKQFTISAENLASGLFQGGLSSLLGETNDWFFLYPYKNFKAPTTEEAGDYSSSGSTLTVKGVQIGAKEIENVKANSKEHIAGAVSPMYGVKPNLDKSTSPDIEMKHLAAVVAIKVNNTTSGNIIVRDVKFSVPRIVSKDPITQKKTVVQEEFPIIGDCVINLTDNVSVAISQDSGAKVYSSTQVTLSEAKMLEPNESLTVYMAVSPFRTSNKTLCIEVNGSARTLKMTSDVLNSGKVTTFAVDVKPFSKNKTEDLSSNAFNITSEGEPGENWIEIRTDDREAWYDASYRYYYEYKIDESLPQDNTHELCNVLSLGEYNEEKTGLTINGQSCGTAYILGTTSNEGLMTFSGWAKDMINALPISFYASGIDNAPVAMTIKSVNIWIPEYNIRKETHHYLESPTETIEYHNLKTRTVLNNTNIGSLISILNSVDQFKDLKVTDNGIARESLIAFVDPNTITFNGIPANGYFSNNNVVVLREEDTHKSIVPGLVDTFLRNKFSLDPNNPATFLGLMAIVNATKNMDNGTLKYKAYTYDNTTYSESDMKGYAEQTANAIYNKIVSVINGKIPSSISKYVSGESLLNIVFKSPTDLIHKLRDMKFELVIQTYPYAETYTKEYPDTPLNPIAFWELHASE